MHRLRLLRTHLEGMGPGDWMPFLILIPLGTLAGFFPKVMIGAAVVWLVLVSFGLSRNVSDTRFTKRWLLQLLGIFNIPTVIVTLVAGWCW